MECELGVRAEAGSGVADRTGQGGCGQGFGKKAQREPRMGGGCSGESDLDCPGGIGSGERVGLPWATSLSEASSCLMCESTCDTGVDVRLWNVVGA